MRFACEQCQTKYSIPDDRVRGKILKIRCKNCSSLISVSEGGARTEQPAVAAEQDSDGGDSTMIGGMADFFGKPAAAPELDDWHLSVDGNQNGPMALNQLAQRVYEQAGTSAELFVWRDGMDGWQPADLLPEVKAAIEKLRSAPAAKPAPATPAPASLAADPDAGDATQIGSLNLPAEFSRKPADDDDVQDASMLSLEPFEAIEALRKGMSPAKPGAKPASPPPPKAPPPMKAPPPFKAPATPAAAPPAAARPATPPPGAGAPAGPSRVAAPMFKTLPHPGLRPAGGPSGAPVAPPSPFLANLPPPGGGLGEPPPPEPTAPPDSGSPLLGAAPDPGPPNLPSAEPSVMAALQFSSPNLDLPAHAESDGDQPAKSKTPIYAGLGIFVALVAIAIFLVVGRAGSGGGKDRGAAIADGGSDGDGGAQAKGGSGTPKTPPADSKKSGIEGLSDSDFQALLEGGQEALTKCFGKALQKDAKLKGTALKVEVEVTAKGKASEVMLEGASSDPKLEKCTEKALKKWKFPKGADKKPYKARFPLTVKE